MIALELEKMRKLILEIEGLKNALVDVLLYGRLPKDKDYT